MVEAKQQKNQEEDTTEQCVFLQTEQIAGEKTENSEDCCRDGNGREEKKIRWLEYHNFPCDVALV